MNRCMICRRTRGCLCLSREQDLSVVRHSATGGVMYLWRIVELQAAQHLEVHPRHPYTLLLKQFPYRSFVEESRTYSIFRGELPSHSIHHAVVVFHPRCPRCGRTARVRFRSCEVADGHYVSCLLA
jgi:oligopeptide/dipeptide ABC transporter ATP-binding protein